MNDLLAALERAVGRRRRRSFVIATGTVVTLALIGWGTHRVAMDHRRFECRAEADAVRNVWNDDASSRLRAAIEGSGAAFAGDAFARAVPYFDAHANAWHDAYAQACIAARVDDTRSESQWTASRNCLDERRGELAARLEAATEAADLATARRIVTLAAGLAAPAQCIDETWLARHPAVAIAETTSRELHERRWRVDGLAAVGGHAEALVLAREVADAAQAAGDGPLHRSALLRAGELAQVTAAFTDSENLLRTAYDLAVAADDDVVALEAAIALVNTVGMEQSRLDEGLWWGRVATGLVDRLGARDDFEATNLDLVLGSVLQKRGEYDEAQRMFEHALAVREALVGTEHPQLSAVLNNLGNVHFLRGQYDEAERLSLRGLALLEATSGPDHPDVVRMTMSSSAIYLARDKLADAERMCERGIALQEHLSGPQHPDLAALLINLANIRAKRGNTDDAQHLYERALAIFEKSSGPDHPSAATCLANMGTLAERRGSYDEAQRFGERALEIRERALGAAHPDVAKSLMNLGSLQRARGSLPEARRLFERALAIREATSGAEHPDVASPLLGLARVALSSGDAERAYDNARRALDIRVRASLSDEEIAVARGVVGQAKWETGDRAAALVLVRDALDILRKAGPGRAISAKDLEDWLAAHEAETPARPIPD